MLIRLVLKGGREDNVRVIEDKTGVDGTETENECGDSSDIVAMAI